MERDCINVITVSYPGRSTVTCARCRECPDGWTGMKTCIGMTCFVAVSGLENGQAVDRGCFTSQPVINTQCNKTRDESDGTPVYHVCCESHNLCNANTTLRFPFNSTSDVTRPPTITISPSTTTTPSATTTPSDLGMTLILF